MSSLRTYLLYIFLIFSSTFSFSQGVGLVLSGGGAAGFAHIGVLKALEENEIPINYIAGSSAGALVGAMYAVGMTPKEMEDYVLGTVFQLMVKGQLKKNQEFLFNSEEDSPSLLSIGFSKDSIFKKSLPTNFIRPELMDFEMLKLFGIPSAVHNNNFDQLFTPFRCVASDIANKKTIVFKNGYLNEVVRASMTYPFFFNPIRINGKLLFDGGLYNNFPADVLFQEFNPDFIIGSNVSSNAKPPSEDDLIGQLTNMMVSYSDFELPCEDGFLFNPTITIGSFDFDNVKNAIDQGYFNALIQIDSLKQKLNVRQTNEELSLARNKFKATLNSVKFESVETSSKNNASVPFANKAFRLKKDQKTFDINFIEKNYFKLYSTTQIQYLYPLAEKKEDSLYTLKLKVTPQKEFRTDVGGLFSSRSINTGFIQLNYLRVNKMATAVRVSSYFGKFHGSLKLNLDFSLNTKIPVQLNTYIFRNRWDYFRSFTTFFEDVKPSFLVQYESVAGAKLKLPITNNSKFYLEGNYFETDDRYFLGTQVNSTDTADHTIFQGIQYGAHIEWNSLDRNQYPTKGNYVHLSSTYHYGLEHSFGGYMSNNIFDYQSEKNWIELDGEVKSFPFPTKYVKIGVHFRTHFSNMPRFANYKASILQLKSFDVTPDLITFFQPNFRAIQYLGTGVNFIISPIKDVDIRFDAYLFQPFELFEELENGDVKISKSFKGESKLAAMSAIYHSPIGPFRATLNYFEKESTPFFFQLTYGYVLFNRREIR